MKKSIAIGACAIVASLASASAQQGDINGIIHAYNEAVRNGGAESKVTAARDLWAAVLENPSRSDVGLLAYEAGQTLCIHDDCKDVTPLAEFAVQHANTSGPLGPEDFKLLYAYNGWVQSPGRDSRQQLDNALTDKIDTDVSLLSMTAFHNRYAKDATEGRWRRAVTSAEEAARHFEPFRNIIGQQWSDARLVAITSSFNHEPDTQNVIDMVRHASDIKKFSASLEGKRPDWIHEQYYLADAWQMAMAAYFQSDHGTRLGTHLRGPSPEDLEEAIGEIENENDGLDRGIPLPGDQSTPAPDMSLPFCEGSFNMSPKLRYPSRAARKGMYGAVILRVRVENLEVSDVEVLAAVPSEGFSDGLVRTVRKWQWEVAEGVPGETCRTSYSNLVWPFVFEMG